MQATETKTDFASTGLLPKSPHQPGLGQAKAGLPMWVARTQILRKSSDPDASQVHWKWRHVSILGPLIWDAGTPSSN